MNYFLILLYTSLSLSLPCLILCTYHRYKGYNPPSVLDYIVFIFLSLLTLYVSHFVLMAVGMYIIHAFDISIPGLSIDFVFYMNQNVGTLTPGQAATFISNMHQSVNSFVANGYTGSLTYTQLFETEHFYSMTHTRSVFTQLVRAKSVLHPRLGEGSTAVTIAEGGAVTRTPAFDELVG